MILFTHVIRETAQFSCSLYIVITEYKYAIKFTLSPLGPKIKIEFILCFVKRMCICLECSGDVIYKYPHIFKGHTPS